MIMIYHELGYKSHSNANIVAVGHKMNYSSLFGNTYKVHALHGKMMSIEKSFKFSQELQSDDHFVLGQPHEYLSHLRIPILEQVS